MRPADHPLTERERALLARHGVSPEVSVEVVGGGANNQVFRVQNGGRALLLKRYFHSPGDDRDRFGMECRFYGHAVLTAPDFIPRPLGWDEEGRCGLFEFVVGRKLCQEEVTQSHVLRAVDFVVRLNRQPEERLSYPTTADSAFSIRTNRLLIQKRFDRLTGINPATHEAAHRLFQDRMLPRWREVSRELEAQEEESHALCLDEEKVISPSDFGFHNALLESSGRIRFFDFEYGGCDDPAKLVCDFFSQPEIPVPAALRPLAIERLLPLLPAARCPLFLKRTETLRIAFHLKWCCIMLNEFLPEGARRRSFALTAEELDRRRERQLSKVKEYLALHATL